MATIIYSQGTVTTTVPAGEKIAIFSNSPLILSQQVGYPNFPSTWDLVYTTTAGEAYLSAAFATETVVKIEASAADGFYEVGASPSIAEPQTDITAADATFNVQGLAAAQGGYVRMTGGTSSTSGNAGGASELLGGAAGATGVGGAATVTGAAGGATSGVGGAATLTAGAGTNGNSAGGVGKVVGGAGQGSAAGGAAQATGGAGGATGTGGAAQVTGGIGGATSGAGGAASVTGGAGTNGNSAGGVGSVTGGAGQGTADGGAATVTGGASGAGATGNGGDASLVGGAASSTNGNGGSVYLTAGALAGTGFDGMIIERGAKLVKQGAATAKTVSATLTAAEILAGIITVNQGAAGASAQQLPLATAMDTGFPDAAAGDAFDFSLINISTTDAEDATITTNTGWTLVGNMEVQAASALTLNTSGRFRAAKTGAGAWTLFRIA